RTSYFRNQFFFFETLEYSVTLYAAYRFNLASRNRLLIRNYSQHLERRLRQAFLLHRSTKPLYVLAVIRQSYKLKSLIYLADSDAAPFLLVLSLKLLKALIRFFPIYIHNLRRCFGGKRLSPSKHHRFK